MQSGAVCRQCLWWWFGLLLPLWLLIGSCATPNLSPVPDRPAKPNGETPPASGTPLARDHAPAGEAPSAREAIERHAVPKPEVEVDLDPQRQRERLEHRMQAVVTCLEEARQAVIAAEVAGAGIEAVRPAIDALNRSEAALREAQAQLIHGEMAQAASPLDRAAAACRAAREFSQQT